MYATCPPPRLFCYLLTDRWFDSASVGTPTTPQHNTYDGQLTGAAGDTKAGVLVGTDRYGNKYFENKSEELPCESLSRCGGEW